MKSIGIVIMVSMLLLTGYGVSFAMTCDMGGESACSHSGMAYAEESGQAKKAVEVGNKVCPVTGEPIAENPKVTAEYKGKIYNLCCQACIKPFNKEPEKYIKQMSAEKNNAGHEGAEHMHGH